MNTSAARNMAREPDAPSPAPIAPDAVDARPILARNSSNVWEATEAIRTRLLGWIEDECRVRGIDALVLQSPPYLHPAWVKFECWVPCSDPTLTRRSSMLITITAMPYHKFTAVYAVSLD